MSDPGVIRIHDYDYALPHEKIAQFPLASRDASKLLVYRHGLISEDVFSNIDEYLPGNSLLVFNNTRVIHARLIFRKPTGGQVEIFCLEPISPSVEIQSAFHQQTESTWKCLVGNLKRWKSGVLVLENKNNHPGCRLTAERVGECAGGCHEILFRWDPPGKTFSEVLEIFGLVPLPPYIDRPAEATDNDRYQTIYAAHDGSVAAPTAGLHFTDPLLQRIRLTGILSENVTLHVGAGTFRPVSSEHIRDHVMHHEKIIVAKKTIQLLLNNPGRPVFAIGTTSARTLESLYWLGAGLIVEGAGFRPEVLQWTPYTLNNHTDITSSQALNALIDYLDANHMEEFSGETQLMIVPGYSFKLISGLVTNFHMPQSTLLLLVAAMVGDGWRTAYEHALHHNFRFLSYGDSCLFFDSHKYMV